MDFLKKYWIYIALPALAILGVVVFLLVFGGRNVNQSPLPPTSSEPSSGLTKEEQNQLINNLNNSKITTPPPLSNPTASDLNARPTNATPPNVTEQYKYNAGATASPSKGNTSQSSGPIDVESVTAKPK